MKITPINQLKEALLISFSHQQTEQRFELILVCVNPHEGDIREFVKIEFSGVSNLECNKLFPGQIDAQEYRYSEAPSAEAFLLEDIQEVHELGIKKLEMSFGPPKSRLCIQFEMMNIDRKVARGSMCMEQGWSYIDEAGQPVSFERPFAS